MQNIVRSDQAFYFMNSIKESSTYWKKFQLEVLALIKQLFCPRYFLTLFCVYYRISQDGGLRFSSNELKGLSYFEKCKLLNANPVILSNHFQHRVSLFFK